jgi:RimJ/RimL family protein N-acetyltransferase
MDFVAIQTERVLLRPVRITDIEPLFERRNDPDIARYQSWPLPYPESTARDSIEGSLAMSGPADGQWWMLTLADLADTTILGDLVVHLTWGGRCAEIGCTLAKSAWGGGYAVEAVEALVDWLWSFPEITRVHATIHPDNVAAAQVLERTGFDFEGRTRLSYWVGDENSDDGLYGMTRDEWTAWNDRPRGQPDELRLVPITAENQYRVRALRVHQSQDNFVSPVVDSLADAAYPPERNGAALVPWVRGVEADGELVGFVMMLARTEQHPEPTLLRLLVDRRHQRRGIGGWVVDQVVDQARSQGASTLAVSWVDERGGPGPLYLRRGFEPTGEVKDGEVIARLTL